jgi:hypothetical protein
MSGKAIGIFTLLTIGCAKSPERLAGEIEYHVALIPGEIPLYSAELDHKERVSQFKRERRESTAIAKRISTICFPMLAS